MLIDAVVFDFGGVLIDWNPRYLYRTIFNNDERMEWFLDNVCNTEWNLKQDRGRPFAEGITILKDKFPDYSILIEFFYSRWEQMLKGEITGTVEILYLLKEKYKIFGLTNWSAETFPIAQKRFSFLQMFDGIVVSGKEKLVKPDKKLFSILLERYTLKPERCIFIDDSLINIEAAEEIGFNAVQFLSAYDLKEKLTSLHVI